MFLTMFIHIMVTFFVIIIIIFSHDLKSNWWRNIPEFPANFPTRYITDRVGFDA